MKSVPRAGDNALILSSSAVNFESQVAIASPIRLLRFSPFMLICSRCLIAQLSLLDP